jgi:HEPN domain-containing protein
LVVRPEVKEMSTATTTCLSSSPTTRQAAEKLVKAALVRGGLSFPKTHDIAALVGLLPTEHRLKAKLKNFEKLTPYGVAYRYPAEDEWEIPSAETIEMWRREIEPARSNF